MRLIRGVLPLVDNCAIYHGINDGLLARDIHSLDLAVNDGAAAADNPNSRGGVYAGYRQTPL